MFNSDGSQVSTLSPTAAPTNGFSSSSDGVPWLYILLPIGVLLCLMLLLAVVSDPA